jgi:hypothetical protein
MKKIILGLSFVAMILSACAGSSKDPEQLDNALAGFAACVQSSRWQEALEYVTSDEAYAISPDGYEFKEEYKVAARRLPLSTLRKAGLELDRHGRLVGIKKAMDEANERYVMSEDQAKVGTNLKEMEDARIKRRIEEGQKILKGEEEEAKAEPEVEVFTNKLTDEEKRKYGSTRDLQAPEAYSDADEVDEDEVRAKEELHGDYETDY